MVAMESEIGREWSTGRKWFLETERLFGSEVDGEFEMDVMGNSKESHIISQAGFDGEREITIFEGGDE